MILWKQDFMLGSHDFMMGSHDFIVGSHDFMLGSHDFIVGSHDFMLVHQIGVQYIFYFKNIVHRMAANKWLTFA